MGQYYHRSENMDEQTELLRKILEVLTLIAEPQIAQQDEKLRTALTEIVGKGQLKVKAVQLMDGTRNQASICKEAKIDPGALSRLLKALREKGLVVGDDKLPRLSISLPAKFWSELGGA
jgi:DNA-binding HxlR family transcriptional regulator